MSDISVDALVDAGRRHQWLPLGQDEGYYGEDALVVTGADGPYFTDARGDRYLDALCLQSAGVLGHNHPRVVDAMREQLDRVVSNVAGLLPSDVSIELARRLAELTGGELTRCMYLLSGSDANDAAIKLARQYWKNLGRGTKYKTIVRRHGYHGGTLATNAASGNNRYPHSAFEPLPSGFVHVTSPYPRGCELCDAARGCTLACAEEIGRAIAYEDPETVACVLAEPTLAAGGLVPPPPGYLKRLREICDEHDVLLILDEVVTAMGRTGAWFEFQREGIVPDAVALAKVLTAGHMPLGALLVREDVAAAFTGAPERAFAAGTTLGGMPLACAAALATIDTIADEGLVARAAKLGEAAEARLDELQQTSRIVAEVRVRGALMGIEWVADRETGRPFAAPGDVKRRAIQIGREHGVHFYGGPASVLLWIPPSNIDGAAMDHLMTAVETVVATLEREFA
jgi:adenosylmethionine-8-amino-7-oxononanoate aminotransferase